MKINEVMKYANSIADEQIPFSTVQQWVHRALTKFNLFWPAVMTLPDFSDLDMDIRFTRVIPITASSTDAEKKRAAKFTSVNEVLCDMLITQYVAYQIKVNDGSENELSDFMREWQDNLKQAKSLYGAFIDEDIKLDGVDTSLAGDGSKTIDNPLVAVPTQNQYVYSPVKTWGEDPGSGVVTSTNKWGK